MTALSRLLRGDVLAAAMRSPDAATQRAALAVVEQAIGASEGYLARAASLLGVSRRALNYWAESWPELAAAATAARAARRASKTVQTVRTAENKS
jgi:hypothetical protein